MSTEHFADWELACRCSCGGLPPQDFQDKLERLRIVYAKPMRISSGYRCPEYNNRVNSTGLNGPHTKGAVDVLVWGANAWDLEDCAKALDWFGIGLNQKGLYESRFIHLDRRPFEKRTHWTY